MKERKLSKVTVFLASCIFAMSVLTAVLFMADTKKKINKPVASTPVIIKSSNDSERISILERKMVEFDKILHIWYRRTYLLGIAANENTNATLKNNQKLGLDNSEYIYFNRDWKLNQLPQNMKLSDEEKEDLKKDVINWK